MTDADERRARRRPARGAGYGRPAAWLPPLALVLLALAVTTVVEPWPEGRVLVTVRGTGPHGVTVSDLVVLAVTALATVLWLRLTVTRRRRVPAPGRSPRRPEGA